MLLEMDLLLLLLICMSTNSIWDALIWKEVADDRYWVQGKFNTVKRFSKSSLRVGREYVHSRSQVGNANIRIAEKGGKPEDQGLNFPEYACHGGGKSILPSIRSEAKMIGFPIWIKGVEAGPIGAIIVSGLAQLEDHQLIVCALSEISADDRSTPSRPYRSTSNRPLPWNDQFRQRTSRAIPLQQYSHECMILHTLQ